MSAMAFPAELEPVLDSLWAQGRAAWPGTDVPRDAFTVYLAARKPPDEDAAAFLRGVHADGLYLACACVDGRKGAHALFEGRLLAQTPSFLGGLKPTPALIEEVKQLLREKLLMPTPEAPPRLAEYSGAGTLGSWLRVVALRTALSLLRQQDPARHRQDAPGGGDDDERVLDAAPDPEMSYIKARYRTEFRQAVQDALASLSTEQRNLLRLCLLDGLNIDELGALFQVHRSTAARWLQSAREEVFERTRRLLEERLRLRSSEAESLIRVVRSQLDVSVAGILRAGEDGG